MVVSRLVFGRLSSALLVSVLVLSALGGCSCAEPQPVVNQPALLNLQAGVATVGSESTYYSFTPDQTGLWLITMLVDVANGSTEIELTGPDGEPVTPQRLGGGDYDSYVVVLLESGCTYLLYARLRPYPNQRLGYTLTASPAEAVPGGGGEVQARGYYSVFEFTPDKSGTWELTMSDSDIYAGWQKMPALLVSDLDFEDFVFHFGEIWGEDSYAEDLPIPVVLEAGVTYRISLELSSRDDSCTLTVSFVE